MVVVKRIAVLGREWRVGLASLALLSLVPLGIRLASGASGPGPDDRDIAEIRRLLENREFPQAEGELQSFLAKHRASPYVPEVEYLLAVAKLEVAKQKPAPTASEIDAVWRQFLQASSVYDRKPCEDGMIETANFARDHGFLAEAGEKYRTLTGRRPEVTLDMALSLALQALAQPIEAPHLLADADRRIDDFLREARGDARAKAILVRLTVYWRHLRYEAMEAIASQAMTEFSESGWKPRFQLERGKARLRLGMTSEALSDLETVRRQAQDPSVRQDSSYFEAEGRLAGADPRGVPLVRGLMRSESPLAPLAMLVYGRYQLEVREEDPLAVLKKALESIPLVRSYDAYAPDFDGLYRRLRRDAEAETDAERVKAAAALFEEYLRLYPDRVPIYFEIADLEARAATRMADPGRAAEFLIQAAKIYERITTHPRAPRDGKIRADWNAANAYRDARRFPQAARHYRAHYEADQGANLESLYRQGLALSEAGLLEGQPGHDPGALEVFSEYLAAAGPGGERAADVVVHRGRILMDLGRYAEAIAELDPLLRKPEYGLDPRKPRWAEALLLKGLSHLEVALRMAARPDTEEARRRAMGEGRRAFHEYLERYAEGVEPPARPPAGALAAFHGLAQAALDERAWAEATRLLERMTDLSTLLPPAERDAQAARIRQAQFLLADLYLTQRRYDDALRAYEAAFRKYSSGDDRLGALLGRARALLRLGRKEDASRALENARQMYTENRESLDKSLDGHGGRFWPGKLLEVEQEIKTWTTRRG